MIVKNIIAIMSKQSFHLIRRNREGSIKNTLLLYRLQYAGKYETLEQPAYTIEETEKGHFLFWYTFLMPGEARIVTISNDGCIKLTPLDLQDLGLTPVVQRQGDDLLLSPLNLLPAKD